MVVVVPFAKVDPDAGPAICVTVAPEEHPSIAVGAVHDAVGVQADKLIFPGHPLNTGAVIS